MKLKTSCVWNLEKGKRSFSRLMIYLTRNISLWNIARIFILAVIYVRSKLISISRWHQDRRTLILSRLDFRPGGKLKTIFSLKPTFVNGLHSKIWLSSNQMVLLSNAWSFYRSQNVLGWSKFFVPDQKFIYILWQSQTFCARLKDDLHSVKLFFVPAQKFLKRH